MVGTSSPSLSGDLLRGAQACADCYDYCIETLAHCRRRGGAQVDGVLFRRLLDCAEICRVTADFLSRDSDAAITLCGVVIGHEL